MSISLKALFVVSLIVFTSASSFAKESGAQVHVAGGISMPGTSTAVFTNPAGLVGASTAFTLQAAAPEVWKNGTYRAGMQTGSGVYGVAAGGEYRNRDGSDPLLAYYGIAVGAPMLSLGVAGKTGISNADGTTINAGLLFSLLGVTQIGVTARGIDDGVSEWGAGIAFEMIPTLSLVFDLAAAEDLDNMEIKPGIKVEAGPAAITMSYATGPREQFADGFTAGASGSTTKQGE